MVFFDPMVELAGISVAISIFHQVLQFKFGNKKQMQEHQEKMKQSQSKVKELMGKTDEKSKKERERLEAEMLESMNLVMKGSMKLMAVSLVVILPVFSLMGGAYAQETISLPVPVPWFANFELLNPLTWVSIKLYSQTNWLGWYVLVSLVFSLLVLNPAMKLWEKQKKVSGNAKKT